MSTVAEPYRFPLGEPDGLALPPMYRKLLTDEPLARIRMAYGMDAWLVSRYDDAKVVLSDPRFSRAATRGGVDVPRPSPVLADDVSMVSMDPPEHTRIRRLAAQAFSVRSVEALRPDVEKAVSDLLDVVQEQGPPVDLVPTLARALPLTVMCQLLGVPDSETDDFRRIAHILFSADYPAAEVEKAVADVIAYMSALVADRRRQPTDDLLGKLVKARDEGDRFNEQELVGLGLALLLGGYENTANEIANFVAVLLADPAQLTLLRDDPSLIPAAVEELLRIVPIFLTGAFVRIALEDVRLSGGVVPKGDCVVVDLQFASRDPAKFERPDELDIFRKTNPHLTFGYGAHRCIGAELARVELQVVLTSLLARFPKLQPAGDVEFASATGFIRGPKTLRVSW